MAHPKRRQSHTRTAKRRTHDKALVPTLAICPNCGRKILDIAGGVYLELVLIRPIGNPIFSNLPEWFITNGQVN